MATPAPSSPSALNRFLGCEHRTYLDILERRGELGAERKPPEMQLLFERGDRHEDGVVAGMLADGLDVVALEDEHATMQERAERTLAAMREGRQVLHQGCFLHDGWVGYPDFLIRVEEPSQLGAWSYEVADAKLGRTPRPEHIFQLLFYNEQLERVQGRAPARMRLILGDGTEPAFRAEDFEAYAEDIRAMFVARLGVLEGPSPDPAAAYIGTVDRFQGQEAPVVLFSMTSSSGVDAARGMSFLFSRNRLNVAVSRAQALAVVVCSPRLLSAQCSTVDDMRLVNMLCRFARAAGGSAARP